MKLWCSYCGESFEGDPYYWGPDKFCSEECKNKFIRDMKRNG